MTAIREYTGPNRIAQRREQKNFQGGQRCVLGAVKNHFRFSIAALPNADNHLSRRGGGSQATECLTWCSAYEGVAGVFIGRRRSWRGRGAGLDGTEGHCRRHYDSAQSPGEKAGCGRWLQNCGFFELTAPGGV